MKVVRIIAKPTTGSHIEDAVIEAVQLSYKFKAPVEFEHTGQGSEVFKVDADEILDHILGRKNMVIRTEEEQQDGLICETCRASGRQDCPHR